MTDRLDADVGRTVLRRSHEDQLREALSEKDWSPVPSGSFAVYVLFNLEAAFDEGHAILALGPVGGPLETFSFYRHGNALRAPALMACLREPMTFSQLEENSGWLVHGQPGNWWNEHVNAAIGVWCAADAYERVLAFARDRQKNPGTYDLVAYNCLTFVDQALAQGGIGLVGRDGRRLRTFIPKDAFRGVAAVTGARPLGPWKYWFPLGRAPRNGLRTISDVPGDDRPLK